MDRFPQRRLDRQDPFDIGLRVDPAELLDRRHRRGLAQQIGEFGRFQRGQNGAQPVGGFRMVGSGIVLQARRMGDQRGGHVSYPSVQDLPRGGG
jgi:hypothetical protein